MEEHIAGTIIVLIGCAMIFGIVFVTVSASNRENLAMIEAGMNPKENKEKSHGKLRNALLMLFVPIGILVGNLTHSFFNMDAEPAAIVFAFLFGGIALAGTYFIERTLAGDFDDKNDTY